MTLSGAIVRALGSPKQPAATSAGGGFVGFVGLQSQRSPCPSPSESSWLALQFSGQLSQTSPTPSSSKSAWLGLNMAGQLSAMSGSQTDKTPYEPKTGHPFPWLATCLYRGTGSSPTWNIVALQFWT